MLLQKELSSGSAAFYTRTPVDWTELLANKMLTEHQDCWKKDLRLRVDKARQTGKWWLHQLWIKNASFDSLIQKANKNGSYTQSSAETETKSVLSEIQYFLN